MVIVLYFGKVVYQKQLELGEFGFCGGVKVIVGDFVNEVQIVKEVGYLFIGVF